VIVLASNVERVVNVLREREEELVAGPSTQLAPAAAKREQAERLGAEATRAEWTLFEEAHWIKATAEDQALARQPAPIGAAALRTGMVGPRGAGRPGPPLARREALKRRLRAAAGAALVAVG
jgi:hypothetical protein